MDLATQPRPTPAQQRLEWNARYWRNEPHGSLWRRLKDALRRDWLQTRADARAGGRDLGQRTANTFRQAIGTEWIPDEDTPNPGPVDLEATWKLAEPGIRYGVGARAQYGVEFSRWNDELERRLIAEWDEKATGASFSTVRTFVRQGWDAKTR